MGEQQKRLLVVEDEEHLAFSLEFNLREEGYDVSVAGTVARARELLEEPRDLIILDVMLPDGDGFTLCEELRSRGVRTPILFLTAKGTAKDIVAGLDAGADDYLTKPFALLELLTRISAMLRRQSWNAEETDRALPDRFEFGGHVIDFSAHEATAMGNPVNLTDLEFRLLRFFRTHENQVVSRADLLQGVWGVSPHTNTRTVDNFLVRLRRVFEHDPARPRHFLTVRGVGYRFVP